MTDKTKEFDRIWLQACGDSMSEWYGEITWCYDKVNDDDVEYVSAKLYAEQAAQMNTAMDERIAAGVRIVELERERDALIAALESFMENVEEPPEINCSCHISPPCNDCVDYSSLREAFELGRAAMKGKS